VGDRRRAIVESGLAILREEGLASFTQLRVASKVGLRQSHLTYYFPTRSDLLAAVLDLAVDQQLAIAEQAVAASGTRDQALAAAARAVLYHQNTRVLVALCQASDQDETVRQLFNKLATGVVSSLSALMARLGLPVTAARVDLLHGLIVGLSILVLATGRDDAGGRTSAVLAEALNLLSVPQGAEGATT
jgi:AcrR family transcriptional regulator